MICDLPPNATFAGGGAIPYVSHWQIEAICRWSSVFRRAGLHNPQEESRENGKGIGQQRLRFVRRGVYCCSAVARELLPLPSPSLGVSSLDLGRSSNVSGPFSLSKIFLFRVVFIRSRY